MILRTLRIVTAGAMLVLAAGVQAQEQASKPWYVAVGAGGAWYADQGISGSGPGDLSYDVGYTGNVSIGRYLDDIRVLRLEVEGVYDHADFNNFGGATVGGSSYNAGLMLNFIYDIHTDSPWIPYLGIGMGYSRVTMDNLSQGGVTAIDGSDDAFSYQFKGGIAYQFNPSMAVTLQYRYFATNDLSFSGQPSGTVKTDGTKVQSAEVGFRFHF